MKPYLLDEAHAVIQKVAKHLSPKEFICLIMTTELLGVLIDAVGQKETSRLFEEMKEEVRKRYVK